MSLALCIITNLLYYGKEIKIANEMISFWNICGPEKGRFLWPWKGPFCGCRAMRVDARSVHRQLSHRLWVEHATAWLLHRRCSDWTGSTPPRDAPSDVQRHVSGYDRLALGERSKLCNRPDWGRDCLEAIAAAWWSLASLVIVAVQSLLPDVLERCPVGR